MPPEDQKKPPSSSAPDQAHVGRFLRPPRDSTFEAGDWEILSRHWYPIARVEDLSDRPMAARLLDLELVLFRSQGRIVVARDLCPHRGMRLSRGWVAQDQLICPYHGLHFAVDGRCTSIPSRPEARLSERLSLTLVPSVEQFGLVWATLSGAAVQLPQFDAWERAGFQQIVCNPIDIDGSPGRQLEGFLDIAHFAFAHTSTFGQGSNPVVPDYTVEPTHRGLKVHYVSDVSNYGEAERHRAPPDFRWRRTFEVFPPFSATLTVDYPRDKQLWILNAACPISARQTRMFCPIARNFDLDVPIQAVREWNDRVFNEDRALVENQKPEDLPLDMSLEVSIPADRTSVAYRRLLKGMGLSLVYAG
jgi:phenylpropionate dioxygenase-like ring-hydroxylating dioxygenase large terminal subunit